MRLKTFTNRKTLHVFLAEQVEKRKFPAFTLILTRQNIKNLWLLGI